MSRKQMKNAWRSNLAAKMLAETPDVKVDMAHLTINHVRTNRAAKLAAAHDKAFGLSGRYSAHAGHVGHVQMTPTYGTQGIVRHAMTKPTILNKQRKASRRPGPVAVYNGEGVLTDYVTTFKR